MTLEALQWGFWFTAGFAAGALYFLGLWWNVRLFAEHRRALTNIMLLLGRIAVLTAVLILAARSGAMPLLLASSGVFVARFAVTRGLRAVPS